MTLSTNSLKSVKNFCYNMLKNVSDYIQKVINVRLDIDSKDLACFDDTDRTYLELTMQQLAQAIYK